MYYCGYGYLGVGRVGRGIQGIEIGEENRVAMDSGWVGVDMGFVGGYILVFGREGMGRIIDRGGKDIGRIDGGIMANYGPKGAQFQCSSRGVVSTKNAVYYLNTDSRVVKIGIEEIRKYVQEELWLKFKRPLQGRALSRDTVSFDISPRGTLYILSETCTVSSSLTTRLAYLDGQYPAHILHIKHRQLSLLLSWVYSLSPEGNGHSVYCIIDKDMKIVGKNRVRNDMNYPGRLYKVDRPYAPVVISMYIFSCMDVLIILPQCIISLIEGLKIGDREYTRGMVALQRKGGIDVLFSQPTSIQMLKLNGM